MSKSNKALLAEYSRDRALACRALFRHRHPQGSPDMHIAFADAFQSKDELVLIKAFRGAAKTTVAEEFTLLEALFGNSKYQLLVCETFDKACQRLGAIKYEAANNYKLYNLFGDLTGKPWNEDRAVFKNGTMIQAIGWDQEVRGLLHLGQRPDRALFDDVESLESVRDMETVERGKRKFWGEIWPAMDVTRRRVRWLGTPLAAYCLIVDFENSEDFTTYTFPLCDRDPDDPDAIATWPDRYSLEWAREEKARMSRNGQLKQFYQEYMLIAHDKSARPFHVERLKFGAGPAVRLPRYTITDPARTANPTKSDLTGWASISWMGSRLIVWESGGDFLMPDQIIDLQFELDKRHEPVSVVIEKDSLDQFLLQPLRAEMVRRLRTLPLDPINAPRELAKDAFIMGLQPFLEAGEIYLVGTKEDHRVLIDQIENFPAGRKDVLNALAYATKVRPGLPVYEDFSQDHIVEDYDPHPGYHIALAFNASPQETTCIAMQTEGQLFTVIGEWIFPGDPKDAITSVLADVKLRWSRMKVIAFCPGEAFDNWTRTPIVQILRQKNMTPSRGDLITSSRGSLSAAMRTTIRGRRGFLVDGACRQTINALFGGYCFPLKADGRPDTNPKPNQYMTLIQGVESLSNFLNGALISGEFIQGGNTATTPDGTRYLTSRPQR